MPGKLAFFYGLGLCCDFNGGSLQMLDSFHLSLRLGSWGQSLNNGDPRRSWLRKCLSSANSNCDNTCGPCDCLQPPVAFDKGIKED